MAKSSLVDDLTRRVQRSTLAFRILVHPNITLADSHVSKKKDDATALDETIQSTFLLSAQRSCYENAPCGEVDLSVKLMEAMLKLAETYEFSVSEIAGGSHGKNSRHYAGVAMDVTSINGVTVSKSNKFVKGFMHKCKTLGATEVLGPGSAGHAGHIHAAWPRNSK